MKEIILKPEENVSWQETLKNEKNKIKKQKIFFWMVPVIFFILFVYFFYIGIEGYHFPSSLEDIFFYIFMLIIVEVFAFALSASMSPDIDYELIECLESGDRQLIMDKIAEIELFLLFIPKPERKDAEGFIENGINNALAEIYIDKVNLINILKDRLEDL